jgi:outer membrane lipoprotein-sorting protein
MNSPADAHPAPIGMRTFTDFLALRRNTPLQRAAIALLAAAAIALFSVSASADDEALARSIVEKADLVRFPSGGFEVNVTIGSSAPGADTETRKYKVLSKGNDNTVVMITEPASERGQIMLMKDRELWVFIPSVSQPIRVPLSQRLTGQVANGDLARANFAGDYKPALLRSETVDGEPMYVLELVAGDRPVTYHRVLYWVQQSNHWPRKAEFYSVSGRLLKTAHYQNFVRLGGRLRPARLVMHDALRQGEESVLEYSDLKQRELPDKIFTKDYLKRLE